MLSYSTQSSALFLIILVCTFLVGRNDGTETPPIGTAGMKAYTIRITTTDPSILPNSPSTVPFRLTFFGENGEVGRYIPGGSEHRTTFQFTVAEQDLGSIYGASVYTTNMSDPWHVKMVNIREEENSRDYCFVFDKWVGWDNTLIWSNCQSETCSCSYPRYTNYLAMLVGPFDASLKLRFYGTRNNAEQNLEPARVADSWQAFELPHLGDIQSIKVECQKTYPNSPEGLKLNRILIGAGNQRNFHCFKFDTNLCGKNSSQSLKVECRNIRCNCA
jgi:hypothetical protein